MEVSLPALQRAAGHCRFSCVSQLCMFSMFLHAIHVSHGRPWVGLVVGAASARSSFVAETSLAAQLAAGGNKLLRLFDVATPGRQCQVIKTHSKKHPGQPGERPGSGAPAHSRTAPRPHSDSKRWHGFYGQQDIKPQLAQCRRLAVLHPRTDACPHLMLGSQDLVIATEPDMPSFAGIISCLAYSPLGDGLLAAGAYSGTAALYDTRTLGATCILSGHTGGITQVCPHTAARSHTLSRCSSASGRGPAVFLLRVRGVCCVARKSRKLSRGCETGAYLGEQHKWFLQSRMRSEA